MEITTLQIVLLTGLAALTILDSLSLNIGLNYPVITGTIAGIIMGDVRLGLEVGGTLQLMVLGVGTYGGASMPDYATGAIIGTAFGVTSGEGLGFAMGLAVPVGLLMVQLDILARFTNTYFLHRVEKFVKEGNFKAVTRNIGYGALPWALSRAFPVFIMLTLGESVINKLLEVAPEWLMGGLEVAGGLLPVVGIAILLKYLPAKQNLAYIIIGFVAAAYLGMSMIGVALVGLALAFIDYNRNDKLHKLSLAGIGNTNVMEGNEDGEYED